MTHGQSDTIPDVSTPIIVAGPEPITPLAAALAALNADITSKPLYLEAAPHAALRDYVAELEAEIKEFQNDLDERCELLVELGLMYLEDGKYYDS